MSASGVAPNVRFWHSLTEHAQAFAAKVGEALAKRSINRGVVRDDQIRLVTRASTAAKSISRPATIWSVIPVSRVISAGIRSAG